MKTKKGFIALITLSIILFTGCSPNSKELFEETRFEYIEHADTINGVCDYDGEIYVIRDKETGVNYICIYAVESFGICPLYDNEGNVVVTEK